MFTIILRLISGLSAAASQVGNITRALIAAGLGRAQISALWAAWMATSHSKILEAARTRIALQITITSYNPNLLYRGVYDHSITFKIAGQSQSYTAWMSNISTASLSQEAQTQACVHVVMKSTGYASQLINTISQEKSTAFQNLCSGLPAAVAALLLGLTPPAQADECIPSSGFFIEKVYGVAGTKATAKLSPSGLWVLQPLQIDLTIAIGTPTTDMHAQIYSEFVAWKNSLNVNQVLDEIENQGNDNGINYWLELTNQANAWVDSLNSGQIQPSGGGGISIQGKAVFNGKTTLNSGVTSKNLVVSIGYIEKQTNVPVASEFPCDPYEYSCSPADMVLESPFYNCKGFIVINNGTLDAFGFSMGNADTSSSAPTLSSLLVPVVVNGKLIQGSSLAQAYGHFYTNEEQIAGTNPFWINQAGSIQERFFLCAA